MAKPTFAGCNVALKKETLYDPGLASGALLPGVMNLLFTQKLPNIANRIKLFPTAVNK